MLGGRPVDVGVMILRTSGCSHFHRGGCSMCGYNLDSRRSDRKESVTAQFERAMTELTDVRFVKVYTSGSFLDECEVPPEESKAILSRCAEKGVRLLVESRPEYVTSERIDEMLATHHDIEIAIGLESANDTVLRYAINKGFNVRDYDRAAQLLVDRKVPLRTYVLLKPPFLTESEAMADTVATVKYAGRFSETVSINPVNVQRGTLVEKLWRSWAYRPPWLWSVLEVLRASEGAAKKIVCDPTGGGRERGAHNCGKCDQVILDSLRAFSTSQDPSKLGSPECTCRDIWKAILEIEGLVVGGPCDLQRFFRGQNWRSKMH